MTSEDTSHWLDLDDGPLEARSELAACSQGCYESHARRGQSGAPSIFSLLAHRPRAWSKFCCQIRSQSHHILLCSRQPHTSSNASAASSKLGWESEDDVAHLQLMALEPTTSGAS